MAGLLLGSTVAAPQAGRNRSVAAGRQCALMSAVEVSFATAWKRTLPTTTLRSRLRQLLPFAWGGGNGHSLMQGGRLPPEMI